MLGTWAKLLIVGVVVGNWAGGNATPQMVALVSGDLVFAALFLLFLRRNPA